MAESMRGMKRSHRCTEVSAANIGQTVTVMGWVQKRRNLGSLIFIDLRDRSGILQIVFDENECRSRWIYKGRNAQKRICHCCDRYGSRNVPAAVNEALKTGDIEVHAPQISAILSESRDTAVPDRGKQPDEG